MRRSINILLNEQPKFDADGYFIWGEAKAGIVDYFGTKEQQDKGFKDLIEKHKNFIVIDTNVFLIGSALKTVIAKTKEDSK